jgi:hypothetical protein
MDWKKGCISVINYAEMNLQFTPKKMRCNLSGKMQGVRQGPPGAPRVLNSGVD